MRIEITIPKGIGFSRMLLQMSREAKIPRIPGKLDKVLAKNLKNIRGDSCQVGFSKQLGIAQSTLNRIENGRASVTLYLLEEIGRALKRDPLDLLRDKPRK